MFKNIRIVSKKKYVFKDVKLTEDEASRVRFYDKGRAYTPAYILYMIGSLALSFRIYSLISDRLMDALSNAMPAGLTLPQKLLGAGIAVFGVIILVAICTMLTIVAHESLHIITCPQDSGSPVIDVVVRLPFSITLIYNGRRTNWSHREFFLRF
jgi:hypothetical protein